MGWKTFLAIFILLIGSAHAIEQSYITTLETNYGQVNINTLKYEPFPAIPGSYVDVWLKIENTGFQTADFKSFTLIPEYPFSLDPGEEAERTIGALGSHQTVLLKYKIRVANNAVEGATPLKYEVRIAGRIEALSTDIFIQTPDPVLTVIKTTTDAISPGSASKINITIQNQGDSSFYQITGTLDIFKQTKTSTGFFNSEFPFTPIGSGNKISVSQIGPGETRDLIFEIVADPSAESKPYKVPLILDFFSSAGVKQNSTEIIGIIVGSEPKIEVIIEETTLSKSKKIGSIILKIINRGVTDIKFATVEIKENGEYKVLSSNKDYIGEIDSDDFQNAEFKISLRKSRDVILPITLLYSDSNNNEYVEEKELLLKLLSKDEIAEGEKGKGGVLILAIILIVSGWFFFKRWEIKFKKRRR